MQVDLINQDIIWTYMYYEDFVNIVFNLHEEVASSSKIKLGSDHTLHLKVTVRKQLEKGYHAVQMN